MSSVLSGTSQSSSSPRHPHADEREELLHVERLGHVVVGAGREALAPGRPSSPWPSAR